MVARGDLGVETPLQHVPLLQKMLIAKANRAGKPVITATQMLRSMVDCPRPTRAEAADVANAILDGTDAVMLSEETASGRYPVESLDMMVRIAEDAETAFPYDVWRERISETGVQSLPEAVADAACTLADDMGAAAIVACTQSGAAARLVARHRPRQPILALTPLPETCLGSRSSGASGRSESRHPDRPTSSWTACRRSPSTSGSRPLRRPDRDHGGNSGGRLGEHELDQGRDRALGRSGERSRWSGVGGSGFGQIESKEDGWAVRAVLEERLFVVAMFWLAPAVAPGLGPRPSPRVRGSTFPTRSSGCPTD